MTFVLVMFFLLAVLGWGRAFYERDRAEQQAGIAEMNARYYREAMDGWRACNDEWAAAHQKTLADLKLAVNGWRLAVDAHDLRRTPPQRWVH